MTVVVIIVACCNTVTQQLLEHLEFCSTIFVQHKARVEPLLHTEELIEECTVCLDTALPALLLPLLLLLLLLVCRSSYCSCTVGGEALSTILLLCDIALRVAVAAVADADVVSVVSALGTAFCSCCCCCCCYSCSCCCCCCAAVDTAIFAAVVDC
jgi:hypothetical protein